PHQWQADEDAVRKGTCSFPVRYLGHVEVEESRGMHVCEDAVKKLKAMGRKSVKSVLWVSADGLRVVDDKTKDLCLSQSINFNSFCLCFCNSERAHSSCRFLSIALWSFTCFISFSPQRERLSHAVGCAFPCLERKQRREKEMWGDSRFDASRTFSREGSFRLSGGGRPAEREPQIKSQSQAARAIQVFKNLGHTAQPGHVSPTPATTSPGEKGEAGTPVAAGTTAAAIPRRHAPLEQLVRQGSFRGFPALSQKNSPFKRQLSLRLNELPSTLQRRTDFQVKGTVPEMEPPGASDSDGINALCTQISSSFASAGAPAPGPPPATAVCWGSVRYHPCPLLAPFFSPGTSAWGEPSVPPAAAFQPGHKRTPSEAERWLEEVSQVAKEGVPVPPVPTLLPTLQPFPAPMGPFDAAPAQVAVFLPPPHMQPPFVPAYPGLGYPPLPRVPVVGITPSQMVANAFCSAAQLQPQPATLLGKTGAFPPPAVPSATGGQAHPRPNGAPWPPEPEPASAPELDPFEAQWAALEGKSATEKPSNPFSGDLQKTFEIEL
uniref:NUMB like endocytic adaptor protein n=1 Tax=Loxodonta africana TaxID=9785 RepID=G3TXW0_LOXAF